jgi:hypothetical protein
MRRKPAQEREVRDHALDLGCRQRLTQAGERLVAIRAVRDQLRDQGVVGGADLVPLLDASVDADLLREPQLLDPPGLWQERERILRVEPHLDRVPVQVPVCYLHWLALRDPKLLLHEVDAGDELGDRVLDLDPAVQLQEPELTSVEHELRGAGAAVADRPCEGDGGGAHLRPQLGIERRGRRLLEHLLVAALHRALALAERDHVSTGVAEELDLDVARALDEPLAEDSIDAEGGLGLALRRRERLIELAGLAHDPHPAPAAACGRLDHQREADFGRFALRHDRDARLPRDPLRLELVPAGAQRLRRGADPDEPRRLDRGRELGALREEAVAGVDRVRAGLLCGADVLLGVEVGRDLDGLVRRACVQRPRVVRGRNRNGADSKLAARLEDAHRDLTAIRNEELLKGHSREASRGGGGRDGPAGGPSLRGSS